MKDVLQNLYDKSICVEYIKEVAGKFKIKINENNIFKLGNNVMCLIHIKGENLESEIDLYGMIGIIIKITKNREYPYKVLFHIGCKNITQLFKTEELKLLK